MANKNVTAVIRGKTSYFKMLGDPVLNYSKDGKEWKTDIIPLDPKGVKKELTAYGIGDRLRTKDGYLEGQPYLSLKQKELRSDGTPNEPVKVVDIAGKPWPQDKLIGNGSIVDIKFAVVDFGPGKMKGVYPRSVRVLELVPYNKAEFEPLSEDDEYFAKAAEASMQSEVARANEEREEFRKDFGLDDLDDDLPFE